MDQLLIQVSQVTWTGPGAPHQSVNQEISALFFQPSFCIARGEVSRDNLGSGYKSLSSNPSTFPIYPGVPPLPCETTARYCLTSSLSYINFTRSAKSQPFNYRFSCFCIDNVDCLVVHENQGYVFIWRVALSLERIEVWFSKMSKAPTNWYEN